MNKNVRFLILLVIVSLSCSSVTDLFTEPALVEATGPILGMTVAASLDDQGQPVDASFNYPVDQPQMVVLVRIGEVDLAPLTFNWYRVTEAGDESLFEQTVEVESRDTAFSSGLNPGILAVGTYKVVATFAGGSETIVWDVVEAQPDDLTAPLGTSASAAGGTPAPGPSGKTPAVVPQPRPQDVSGPVPNALISSYNKAPQVAFNVLSAWFDAQEGPIISPISFTIQVSAAITGLSPGRSREYTQAAGTTWQRMDYLVDPCTLPGRRDLPDTSITVSAVPLGYEALQHSETKILGPDTSRPKIVQLISAPSNGANVEGKVIELTAIAEELKSGGSWQTGVSKIVIQVMNPKGVAPFSVSYAKEKGKSCEDKSWKQTTDPKYYYKVPEVVEGDVKICAFAEDFAGNKSEEKCYTYPTGKKLAGKMTSTTTDSAGGSTLVFQVDSELSLTLQADGTLTGTGELTFSARGGGPDDCGGTYSQTYDPAQFTLPVTGEWTEDEIVFRFTIDDHPMATYTFTGCGQSLTEQQDVTASVLAGTIDWHAAWDGQAYTADETSSSSGAGWTQERHWKIHLEPPAPAVGFNPGPWVVTSADQASMLLAFP